MADWVVYNANGDDFRNARDRCSEACEKYNQLLVTAPAIHRAQAFLQIVKPFEDWPLGSPAPNVKAPLFMDYGLRVKIDPSTFINRGCKILDTPVADITIGKRCLLGPDVNIISVSHPLNPIERTQVNPSRGKPVTIGDDVWIGSGAEIHPGVTVGDGAVIYPGALVVKDVPARCAVAGIPAVVVRHNLHLEPWISAGGMVGTIAEALNLY